MTYALEHLKDPITLGIIGLTFVTLVGIKTFGERKNLPPGPPGLPMIGNTIELYKNQNDIPQYFWSLFKKYGPIISVKIFHVNIVVLQDYDTIREAFVKRSDKFGYRPAIAFTKIILRQEGIAAINGPKHKVHRKFGLVGLRDFGMGKKSIESKIQEEIQYLTQEIMSYGSKPWDPTPVIILAISNIISNIVFGHRFEYSDENHRSLWIKLHKAVKHLSVTEPAFVIEFLADRSPKVKEIRDKLDDIDSLTEKEVRLHRDSFDPGNIRDFVDLFLKQEQEETDGGDTIQTSDLKSIIRDLYVAGTDTTTVVMLWGLSLLTTFPEVQKKCQDEIDQVIGTERNISIDDLEKLPFLQATCAEFQRFRTIAPLSLPHSVEEDVEFRGYTIPRGSMVIGSLHAVHNNPEYFGEDVDTFRPERFMNEEGKFVKNKHFIPFSIGSRICIGEILARHELFMMFGNFLQQFTFERVLDESFDLQGTHGVLRVPKQFEIIAKKRSAHQ